MDRIARLPAGDRRDLFAETADRRGMTPAVVEKDFWVCFLLQKLFSSEVLKEQLLFKGGTSLSKVYGLLERFSEDIDLVLNWDGLTDEDPYHERSRKKQTRLLETLRDRASTYIKDTILPLLTDRIGEICTVTLNKEDSREIDIQYPESFPSAYLRPGIKCSK